MDYLRRTGARLRLYHLQGALAFASVETVIRELMARAEGADFFTWDPILHRQPDRDWRRWGTDRLIRTLLTVIHEYRTAHDSAPRIGIMDLSRPQGGFFGPGCHAGPSTVGM